MLLVTPFSPGLTDYTDYTAFLIRRGKLLNHVHLIVARPEDEAEAYEFGEKLADHFRSSHTSILAPKSRNAFETAVDLFRAAARFASTYKASEGEMPDPAMLYMDPSYRPSENGWLDKIQSEYYLKRGPLVFGKFEPNGHKVLQGPAVFRKDFFKVSGLLPYVPPNIHWRNYLQHEILTNAVETTLIGHGKTCTLKGSPRRKKPATTPDTDEV